MRLLVCYRMANQLCFQLAQRGPCTIDIQSGFQLNVIKTRTKPITYQLDYSANLKL